MALWDTKCTASPLTPISTSTPSPIITHPINKLYYLLWCTGPELSVKKTACRTKFLFLKNAFKQNCYEGRQIHKALICLMPLVQPDNELNLVALLLFVGPIFNRINRVLAQHNIKYVDLPT
jgi:hypothetical protein